MPWNMPLCHEDPGIGGCVDYQFRMVTSPLTTLILLLLLTGTLKWNLPALMVVPYALGRLITGISDSTAVQLNIATPLLTVAYFWGHVAYSKTPEIDAAKMLVFSVVWIFLCTSVLVHLFPDAEMADDAAQLVPMILSCVFSWLKLAKHKNWFWFAGLAWGICIPALLPMMGIRPYKPFGAKYPLLDGPVLWYSDSMITLPLVIYGMIRAGIEGKPAALKEE